MKIKITLAIVLTTVVSGAALFAPASAQTYTISENSTMTIYGSANVTDWEAVVKTLEGEVVIRNEDEAGLSEAAPSWFESVEITIPVEDLDSDSRRMNNNMHEYLEEDDHPNITYSLTSVDSVASAANNGIVVSAQGVVTAAGTAHEITHDVTITPGENGMFTISGETDLVMTDFGIDPPTALLGSIRARDEMNIEFEVILEASR